MLAETRIGRALFNAIRNLARGVRPGASPSCLKNTHDNIPDGRNAWSWRDATLFSDIKHDTIDLWGARARGEPRFLSTDLRKHQTFRNATTGFCAKWSWRNEGRNSMPMTCHYPYLGSASDCSCLERNFSLRKHPFLLALRGCFRRLQKFA